MANDTYYSPPTRGRGNYVAPFDNGTPTAGTGTTPTTATAPASTGKPADAVYVGYVPGLSVLTDSEGRRYTYGPRRSSGSIRGTTIDPTGTRNYIDADGQKLIDAANVRFTGTTDAERLQWLKQRRAALIARAGYVESAITTLAGTPLSKVSLIDAESINTVTSIKTAVSVGLPGFGTALSTGFDLLNNLISGQQQADLQQFRKDEIRAYSTDYIGLAKLVKSVDAERTSLSTEPANNAPTPGLAWYWYVAAGFVLLIGYRYYSTHKRKRRHK